MMADTTLPPPSYYCVPGEPALDVQVEFTDVNRRNDYTYNTRARALFMIIHRYIL